MDWLYVILSVVGIIAVLFAVKWEQTRQLLKETAEFLEATSDAMEDKNITNEEVVKILKELTDMLIAGKRLFKKG